MIDQHFVDPINRLIGLVGRVFSNGPGDLASISGRVITDFKNGTWHLLV